MVEAKTGAKRKLIDYRKNPPQPYSKEKVPGNVWEFSRVRFKMDEYENHPTQKPESLLERIVKASSNEGDIVLDNFLGSAEDPIALAQWVSAFDKTTQFEVVPFARNEKVEEAIQTPDEIIPSGQLVRANKHTYKPAPIEE